MNRRVWRVILILCGLPVLALAVALVGGAFLPESHEVTSRALYRQAPESVWSEVSDPARAAAWRPDIERVEMLPEQEGRVRWREIGPAGGLTYERVEIEPPRRLVIRIAEPDLPFSGEWTYRLAPAEGGTALTLTERGAIHNPVYRFLARFVFGYHSTLDAYLTALGARFGETIVPRHEP